MPRIIIDEMDFYTIYCEVNNYISLQMETPKKRTTNTRLYTTAATEKIDTIENETIRQQKRRIDTQIYGGYTDLKKKLLFPQNRTLQFQIDKKKQAFTENTFRRDMITYLNTKFAQALDKTKSNTLVQPSRKRMAKLSQKSKQQMKNIFKQYIYLVRQEHVGEKMTELQLGNILKGMNFIKNLLQQRLTVSKLWKEIQFDKRTGLYMFFVQYYILDREQKQQDLKQQIVTYTQNLFWQEGFSTQTTTLLKQLTSAFTISKQKEYSCLRSSRQNRPTASSLSRSIK